MLADHYPFNERVADSISKDIPLCFRHTELFHIYGVRLPLVLTEWCICRLPSIPRRNSAVGY
jgi:hypothetical protein